MSDNQHEHNEPQLVQHGNQPAENPDVQHGDQPAAATTVNVSPNGSVTADTQPLENDDDGGGFGDIDGDDGDEQKPPTRRKK